MTSSYFALLAEFETADIPLRSMSLKYFGLKPEEAERRAAMHRLPVPAYRAGSQKAPWLVSAADLAKHIDARRQAAAEEWKRMQAVE